jgi:hypothetical protein
MNRWMWLALWVSVQLFFIASLSWVLVRVEQVYRLVRRYEASCRQSVGKVKEIEAAIVNEGHT